jgi:glucose-1-phosphate adenylyltransferase
VHKNLDFIRYHNPENILILSGDHIYQMDYADMIDYHIKKNADLTMAFIKVENKTEHRFGIAAINDEDGDRGGRVTDYWEKPESPKSDWISLTVLCFKPEVLYKMLSSNQAETSFEFGRNIVPAMMDAGYRVYGYKYCGYWGYTKTIDEYWQSNMDLLGENPLIDLEKWGFRTNLDHRDIRDFQPTVVGDYASVQNSLIYNGCHIEGTVKNSIIFPGVIVGKNSVVEDSVLFFNNVIGRNCRLSKVVADVNTVYEDGVIIGAEAGRKAQEVSVIGWNNRVPEQTIIGEGATIWPELSQKNWKRIVLAGEVLK